MTFCSKSTRVTIFGNMYSTFCADFYRTVTKGTVLASWVEIARLFLRYSDIVSSWVVSKEDLFVEAVAQVSRLVLAAGLEQWEGPTGLLCWALHFLPSGPREARWRSADKEGKDLLYNHFRVLRTNYLFLKADPFLPVDRFYRISKCNVSIESDWIISKLGQKKKIVLTRSTKQVCRKTEVP